MRKTKTEKKEKDLKNVNTKAKNDGLNKSKGNNKSLSEEKKSLAKTKKTSANKKDKKSNKLENTKAGKKSTIKKTSKKKASIIKKIVYKQSASEKKLVKDLSDMLVNMDSEGLLFLIEQARVHLYNMEVIALQDEVNKIQNKKACLENIHEAKTKSEKFTVQKSSDNSVYHVIYDGKWKMLNANELFKILKIVNAPVEADDLRLNVLTWFFKERSDFVADFGMTDTHDPRWWSLIEMFQTNFKLSL